MAARGSVYNPTDAVKARFEDGRKVSLLGYFTQTSTSKLDNGDEIVNANFVVTDVEYASKAASHKAARPCGIRHVSAAQCRIRVRRQQMVCGRHRCCCASARRLRGHGSGVTAISPEASLTSSSPYS